MESPSHSARGGARRRKRIAVLLGLSACVALVGGWITWQASSVEGQETCSRCGLHRDVDRRGPFWFHSEPYASKESSEVVAACAEHTWVRGGCWQEGSGYRTYAPVVVKR